MQDQLLRLQLRPQSGGHFMPVDISVVWAVSSPWCGFRYHYIRASAQELPVFRYLPAAITAGLHVTLGLAYGVCRKPMQLLLALWRRGHESVKFLLINMLVHWTSQILTLPLQTLRIPQAVSFCLYSRSSSESERDPTICSRRQCFNRSMTLPTPLAPSPMVGREAISLVLIPCRK